MSARKKLGIDGENLAAKTNELEEKKEESVLVEGSSKEKEGVS